MYFENNLEEKIFARIVSLLNQLYGGFQAQEEHFKNKRKNLVVLPSKKTTELEKVGKNYDMD